MEYLKIFDTEAQYNAYANSDEYVTPNVSLVADETVKYNIQQQHDYSKDYFTVKALGSGTIHWSRKGMEVPSYRINGGEWCSDSTVGYYDIPVNENDEVEFSYNPSNVDFTNFITVNTDYEVYGNIFSLMYGDNFEGVTTFNKNIPFQGVFNSDSTLVSAENLILPATTLIASAYTVMFKDCSSLTTAPELPATTLTNYCYNQMFYGCTSLTTAPELPATTLAENCYNQMFAGCTSLTQAPSILPATTLTQMAYCYNQMFYNCSSLTTAPELPATTLETHCYETMFFGCTSLNYVKCLATDISASYCTQGWLFNVAATGTFVKNPNMSSWTTGSNGIPEGWTVEDAS